MPLPDTATTIHGGCNCGSIRYRIAIPELSKRIPHAYNHADGAAPQVHFPFIATCNCNDCRVATGSLLGGYICVPATMLWVSALSPLSAEAAEAEAAGRGYEGRKFEPPLPEREAVGRVFDRGNDRERGHRNHSSEDKEQEEGEEGEEEEEEGERVWQPGMDMLTPTEKSRDSFVRFFHSSPKRTRAFCGRCGTNVSYNIWPMLAGFPDIVDIVLGTVDREDLEHLKPEHQLWWDYGIGWIKDMARGLNIPTWGGCRPNEDVIMPK